MDPSMTNGTLEHTYKWRYPQMNSSVAPVFINMHAFWFDTAGFTTNQQFSFYIGVTFKNVS